MQSARRACIPSPQPSGVIKKTPDVTDNSTDSCMKTQQMLPWEYYTDLMWWIVEMTIRSAKTHVGNGFLIRGWFDPTK